MNKNAVKRIIVMVSVFTLSIILLCGCASSNGSSKSRLEEQVCTDQLLNYYFEDGTMASSTVKEFEIISSRTFEGRDTSEVRTVLSDNLLERTLYLTVVSSKYEQGWFVDDVTVTDSYVELVGDFDEDYVASLLAEDSMDHTDYSFSIFGSRTIEGVKTGFHNINQVDRFIQNNTFYADYSVNDSYTYLDLTGIVKVSIGVSMSVDDANICHVDRNVEINTDSIVSEWNGIYGSYRMNIPSNQVWDLGDVTDIEQYLTFSKDKSIRGYLDYTVCDYWYDNYDHHHEDLPDASFNVLNHSTAYIEVSKALDVYEYIVFEPDKISYRCLYENGTDFASMGEVFFERVD